MPGPPLQRTPDDQPLPEFGAELRRLRSARDMSLAQLAKQVHYSKGFLSKVENGRAQPNDTLARACDELFTSGTTLTELVKPRPRAKSRWTLASRPIDLPSAARHFVGRTAEVARVVEALRDTGAEHDRDRPGGRIVVISGLPGVGKTQLAVHAAGELLAGYPDGCLYVDVHATAEPLGVAQIMDRVLRRLGLPGDAIPHEPDERSALYRTVLRDRRMLLVLDNPASAADVAALLPPGGSGDILVAGRRRLDALDEAVFIALDVLDPPDARSLFERIAADRSGDLRGPAAVAAIDRITDLCGRLPLAVRVIAARFRSAPLLPLADLVGQLTDERERIPALSDGERSVAETFTSACEALPSPQARLFALLALHPGRTFDVRAAGIVAGADARSATSALAGLAGAHLLLQVSPDRYAFHDFVRSVAVDRARTTLDAADQDKTAGLLVTGYLHAAQRADVTATPDRHREPQVRPSESPWYATFADAERAAAWFETEQDTLVQICDLAAATGREAECWKLAYALRDHFFRTRSYDGWIRTHRRALDAARACADPWAAAVTMNNLGIAYAGIDRTEAADELYAEALVLFRRLDDGYGEANTIGHLAWTAYCRGEFEAAVRHGGTALAFYEANGVARNAGITLRTVALAEAALGRTGEAMRRLRSAVDIFAGLGLAFDEAMALNCIGDVAVIEGDRVMAMDAYQRGLIRARTAAATFEEIRSLRGLFAAELAAGRPQAAQRLREQLAALGDTV